MFLLCFKIAKRQGDPWIITVFLRFYELFLQKSKRIELVRAGFNVALSALTTARTISSRLDMPFLMDASILMK